MAEEGEEEDELPCVHHVPLNEGAVEKNQDTKEIHNEIYTDRPGFLNNNFD